jgi:thymidylate synthase
LRFEERYVLYFKKLDPTMVPLELQVPNIQEYFDNLNVPKRAISLMWNQRSVDTFLGLPFNIASYALLLMMIADEVNMVPDELIGNLGDVHLYLDHIDQAKEQITREPMKLPTVHVRDGIYCSSHSDVLLFDYESHPSIKAPLSN